MKEKKTLKERWVKTKEDLKDFWHENGSWICTTLAATTLTGLIGYVMGENGMKQTILGGLTNAQMDTDETYAIFKADPSKETLWDHPIFFIATENDMDSFAKENNGKKIEVGS